MLTFFAAFLYRLRAPAEPFIDPDVGGYLNPGLLAFSDSGFQHLEGRSFVYPGFIYLILSLFQDFRAITTIQHILGIAAAGILLMSWNGSRQLVKVPITSRRLHRLLGIPLACLFLFNTNVFRFEHEIRPEAICPFFAALSMWFNINFIRYKWGSPKHGATLLFGSLNLFTAVLISFLKPSFYLATVACSLPALLSLLDKKEPVARRVLLAGISAFCVALFLVLPEQILMQKDRYGKAFLPTTLFVVHAKIIRDQILSDIKSDSQTPYSRKFLESMLELLDREITASKKTQHYRSLGFDPDYLMYDNSFNRRFLTYFEPSNALESTKQFYYYYFWRTWTHRPAKMIRKVLTQLGLFYDSIGNVSPYKTDNEVTLREKYAMNLAVLHSNISPVDYAPLREFARQSRLMASAKYTMSQPVVVSLLSVALWRTFSLCFILALTLSIVIAKDRAMRRNYGLFVATLLLIYSYSFANSLGIAVIHSLEVARYSTNQLIYCLLPHSLTIWLAAEVLCFKHTRWERPSHGTIPETPGGGSAPSP